MTNLCVPPRRRAPAKRVGCGSTVRVCIAAALLAVVVLIPGACAHGGRDEEPPDRAREMEPRETGRSDGAAADAGRDPGTEGEPVVVEREIDEDRAIAMDSGVGTPQRQASLRVVEEGKGYLVAGRPREAAQRFTRATQIDPTNGFAYYYLGRARIVSGDRSGAVGVLQKAESLLGPYPEWREATRRLLASIGAS